MQQINLSLGLTSVSSNNYIIIYISCRAEANDLALQIAQVVTGHKHTVALQG